MLTVRGTQALIDLEDASPDFLFTELPEAGLPIWPHVRYSFAQAAAESDLKSVAVSQTGTRFQLYRRLLRSYFPDARDSRSIKHRAELLFIVGGVTTRKVAGGRENWLIDPFARSSGHSSVVVQERPIGADSADTPVFGQTFTFDPSSLRAELAKRISPMSKAAVQAVEEVMRAARSQLDIELSDDSVNRMIAFAISDLARVSHLASYYERLLDTVQPKVALVEDASYGSRAAALKALKAREIVVIEPQHGWIGPSHAAYNFGAAMAAPELRASLPDALMTFGEFWSSRIRHPAEIVSIGKPHMDAMSRGVPGLVDRPRQVLVVSSVSEPNKTASLVLNLRDQLPSPWRVVFRPHPSEQARVHERYPSLADAERVSIDPHTDVYESLRNARGVVGYASTVLYEAIAMGCPVFVVSSPATRYYTADFFGAPIDDGADLPRVVQSLLEPHAAEIPRSVRESVWRPGAEQNFREYLSGLL